MLAPLHFAFVQRGFLELLLLSVPAGLLGTWIVLRGLTFFSHAVATAAFPGLVIAEGLSLSGPLCAFAAAILFAAGVERLTRRRASGHDSVTAMALVGALALGVILASDVFHSAASVESLLFGSVLLVGWNDVALAAATAAVVTVAAIVLGRRWLAAGFDAPTARALGARSALPDAVLLGLVALTVVAALSAVGALLATALVVVPAATVRLLTDDLRRWQLASIGLTALEGCAGLWLSVRLNVPPGASIALVGGVGFAIATVAAKRRVWALGAAAAAGVALLVLGGWGPIGGRGVTVVATTTQLGDWARAVAGPDAHVHQILQPNTDPHEYEPRPRDVERTAHARLVLENGDGLDRWMRDVTREAGGDPQVVVLGDLVPVQISRNPHWWHDPRNAIAAVNAIRDALVRADPAHRAGYERRAAAYATRARALDARIGACLGRIPPAQRTIVTDHDGLGYFARRYGLRVVGSVIPSQTTEAQPSAGELAKLVDLVRREHVRAVFPESSANSRLARAVARETGVRAGGKLYVDTLAPGRSWLATERANADMIARGLTGRGCG